MLPNLIIIGAMKCGTTSLHYYLKQHPQIKMSSEKELNFFVQERTWSRGLRWYQAQFPSKPNVRIYGKASPAYSNFPQWKGVPERMHSILHDVKFIYLVRDPVNRVLAHYTHNYASGSENRSLTEVLSDLNETYVWRSQYYMQIEQYLAYFLPAQILILDRDELLHQRRQTLRRIFEFLDVDEHFDSPAFDRIKHETQSKRRKPRLLRQISTSDFMRKYVDRVLTLRWRTTIERVLYYPLSSPIPPPILSDDQRQRLINTLKPDADQLRRFTGNDFAHWSV